MAASALAALSLLVAACSPTTETARSEESTSSTAQSDTPADDSPGVDPDPDIDSADPTDPNAPTDSEEGDTDGDAETESADGVLSPSEVLEVLADLDGQLAIGNGPLVAVARPDGRRYIELDGGQTNLASQPTWSADGSSLVWSSVSALAQEARVQRFDDEGVAAGEPLVSDVAGPPVFYFQWNGDGSEILYLRNSTRRQTVEAGVLSPGGEARWLADGDPFFVAWAPTESVIAAHVAEERVALFDPADAAALGGSDDEADPGRLPLPVPENPVEGDDVVDGGGFSSPAWLDDTTLLTVVAEALSAVDVETGAVESILDVGGPIRFVLSPDRSRVAFQLAGDLDPDDGTLEVGLPTSVQAEAAGGSLIVVDLDDREVAVVTDRPAVAWEWSPDGEKLAWLELEGPISRRRGRWRFWSVDGPVAGDVRSPTVQLSLKETVSYLPFFAQYSFSLQRWSPDSSAFALVGSNRGRSGVWVQLVDVPAEPVLVAPGDVVSWGFGPTPAPDAGLSPA